MKKEYIILPVICFSIVLSAENKPYLNGKKNTEKKIFNKMLNQTTSIETDNESIKKAIETIEHNGFKEEEEFIKKEPTMTRRELIELIRKLQNDLLSQKLTKTQLEIKAEREEARKLFLIDLMRLNQEEPKMMLGIIDNPYSFEDGIKKLATQNIKKGNYYLLLPQGVLNSKNLEEYLKNSYQLTILRTHLSRFPYALSYSKKLYSIYNNEVLKVLEKKYGKDFLSITEKKFSKK